MKTVVVLLTRFLLDNLHLLVPTIHPNVYGRNLFWVPEISYDASKGARPI